MPLLRRLLASLALIAFATLVANGGVRNVGAAGVGRTATSVVQRTVLRVAIFGDPQNYGPFPESVVATSSTYRDHNERGARQFTAEINAIIAWKPDLVIIAGDLTASTGGRDQNDVMGIADDPDLSIYSPPDREWPFFRAGYDRLRAAGLPVFLTVGNHDSCFEFERWFPKAEWDSLPYAYSSLSRPGLCGPTAEPPNPSADTTHRAALIPTPLGTVCVVGLPTDDDDWEAPDNGWYETTLGCGANRPTITVTHKPNGYGQLRQMAGDGRPYLLAFVSGHAIPSVSRQEIQTGGTPVALSLLDILVNFQQESATPACPLACPTGGSWWVQWTIDPIANTSRIVALNAEAPDSPAPEAGVINSTLTLPMNFCASFGGPQC